MTIEELWSELGFTPNEGQRNAIKHVDGPLFLTAGPGSGKTRVLLWRTLNLIVFHNVKPSEIFLSTFTEKAAKQLKDGLKSYLGHVTNKTGVHYDLSQMALGTVHSICRQLLTDRRFSKGGERRAVPQLMDEVSQYFHVSRNAWVELMETGGFERNEDDHSFRSGQTFINEYTVDKENGSKHLAVTSAISSFNRYSEEALGDYTDLEMSEEEKCMQKMYLKYKETLVSEGVGKSDFSLIQHEAYKLLEDNTDASNIYKHVIIDEYQDTNAIQEKLYFKLAKGHKNICVVGDDDQALYRFRGATVENLVDFSTRCKNHLDVNPTKIRLNINYRSRKEIVDFYTQFMVQEDWTKGGLDSGFYRVMDKGIKAFSTDENTAIVTTDKKDEPAVVYDKIAKKIREMKEIGIIEDYNQVAFLFPSLKYMGTTNTTVLAWMEALKNNDIQYYAPRASRFLDVDEAKAIIGCIVKVFGTPDLLDINSQGYNNFMGWVRSCRTDAEELMEEDLMLADFIKQRKAEWKKKVSDFEAMEKFFKRKKWNREDPFDLDMNRELVNASGLSDEAKKALQNRYFMRVVANKVKEGRPYPLKYVINRITALDWSILDLFYQLLGFKYFKEAFDLAENGTDEGPICNYSVLSKYLARWMEEYSAVITGGYLCEKRFINTFFNGYCYSIYRLAESEFENADDPFPKGRVSFLTIHQSKGLEFPVVVMGNMGKSVRDASPLEESVRSMTKKEGEPLERLPQFDAMRMFYVAFSRAERLLILPEKKRGRVFEPLKWMRTLNLTLIDDLDVKTIPPATIKTDEIGNTYSYTADYMNYKKCPRNYMIFRKYDFIPSRSQSQFFGSLVHNTIEDLHHYLINLRKETNGN